MHITDPPPPPLPPPHPHPPTRCQGVAIAVVDIDAKWVPNKPLECLKCYGTSSLEHPAVQMVAMERGKYYMGGKVTGLALPKR